VVVLLQRILRRRASSVPGHNVARHSRLQVTTSKQTRCLRICNRCSQPLSHHCKNHTRPFQCPSCPSRHPTKRQLHRHINERHLQTEKYFCPDPVCKRSRLKGGRPFPREDNCRKHMRTTLAHHWTGVEEVACDMDEETKRIRMERKVGKRAG
jgi:hypothetical protein